MNDQWLATLATVTQDVLKATAFAWGETCALEELSPQTSPLFQSRVKFRGQHDGDVRLVMPRELGAMLAADILSDDADSLLEIEIEDACNEIANVICGQWLTGAFGTLPVFTLSVPEATWIAEAEWQELLASKSSIGVQVDDLPLMVNLFVS